MPKSMPSSAMARMVMPSGFKRFEALPAALRSRARRNTALYRLKTPTQQIAMVRITRWPKGWTQLPPSGSSATARRPSPAFLTRAGEHAQTLHKHYFCNLLLRHVQLDELRTRLRNYTQVLWLAIDPRTKILPVLQLGPRTQHMAHVLVHSLRQSLAPGGLPLFTSDGLNLYFYALTAHFGHWREVGCRGRKTLR